MLYSEAINSWTTKTELTITDNNTISPDGTQNASYIQQTIGGNAISLISPTVNVVSGQIQTISFFAKAKEVTSITLRLGVSSAWGVRPRFTCNLTNGTITLTEGTGTVSSQNMGNGWYRFVIIATAAATTGTNIQTVTGAIISPTTGDGFYLWGAQWEQNASYATTYIRTTTAAVTRVTDVATENNIFTNGMFTASGGTWFIHLPNTEPQNRVASVGLNLVASNANIEIRLASTALVRPTVNVIQSGLIVGYILTSNNSKIAVRWNGSTTDIWVNGAKASITAAMTATQFQTLTLQGTGNTFFVNQSGFFPRALTDAELIEMTTL
jgi:hypothetical protein